VISKGKTVPIRLNQCPPDLVVKIQPVDIVDVILWRVLQQFPLFSLLPLSPSQQNSFTVVDGFIKVKSG